MKATIEFDGDDAERDTLLALHAGELFAAIWDIDQECRSRIKHAEGIEDAEACFLERLREMAREAIQLIEPY